MGELGQASWELGELGELKAGSCARSCMDGMASWELGNCTLRPIMIYILQKKINFQ